MKLCICLMKLWISLIRLLICFIRSSCSLYFCYFCLKKETSGRIMFRKPMKRNAADEQVTTSDNSSAPTAKLKKENKELSNNLSKSKTVTVSSASSNLLSFDQTEDDDDA